MNIELFCNGKRIKNATWADTESVLPKLKGEAFLLLTILPKPETGPSELEIQAESGNYLPGMLGSKGTGATFYNPVAEGGEEVEIGGYEYDPSLVTQDYDLIIKMIKEFYHTGNVSRELWRPQPK